MNKNIFLILSSIFLSSFAAQMPLKSPVVILGKVINKTGKAIEVKQRVGPHETREIVIARVSDDPALQTVAVNKELPFSEPLRSISQIQFFVEYPESETPTLSATIRDAYNALSVTMYNFFMTTDATTHQPTSGKDTVYAQQIMRPNQLGQALSVDLIVDGQNFEKSKIEVSYVPRVMSLKDRSLQVVAQQIYEGKLTLVQAKRRMPKEMHADLDALIAAQPPTSTSLSTVPASSAPLKLELSNETSHIIKIRIRSGQNSQTAKMVRDWTILYPSTQRSQKTQEVLTLAKDHFPLRIRITTQADKDLGAIILDPATVHFYKVKNQQSNPGISELYKANIVMKGTAAVIQPAAGTQGENTVFNFVNK